MKQPAQVSETVRTLSENEIQDRLYGGYGRRRDLEIRSGAASASTWTGSEILTGEVKRLRAELISLRLEKERLVAQMKQTVPVSEPQSSGAAATTGWLSRMLGILIVVGALAYLFNGPLLQASPMLPDTTPYTVQVAVYDVKGMANRAQATLQELGYDAFLVASARKDGSARYLIYVGSFVTKEEARLESERLSKDPRFADFKDAFVRNR